MWQKVLSTLLGALIQQIPKIVASISDFIQIQVEKQRAKSEAKKAAKALKEAKTKKEIQDAANKLP